MRTKLFISFMALGLFTSAFGQKPMLELTFTAVSNTSYVQIDSIKVMNRTRGGDTLLYWPDTVLSFEYVGIPETGKTSAGFHALPAFPNPATDQATIVLFVPERDRVDIAVFDVLGRQLLRTQQDMERGFNTLHFTPGNQPSCLLSARWRGCSASAKVLSSGTGSSGTCKLEYGGITSDETSLKYVASKGGFSYYQGDTLLYIGYTDTLESGIPGVPFGSESYAFQFAYDMPCPGMPTVTYEGQIYTTVQIFSQCWFRENLNVGTMIPGQQEMEDNWIIEKYCHSDAESYCSDFGALYQWNEVMKYTAGPGTQGICPPGWHIPTDEEWKILEGAADSQFGIGDPVWEGTSSRGYDAGMNLKSESTLNGANITGFSALLGGIRALNGSFSLFGNTGDFWTSDEFDGDNAWNREVNGNTPFVARTKVSKSNGFSVRCLQDY